MWSSGLGRWTLSEWCGFKSCRGKNKNLTALKSNSNTVWFNFQTYILFSINLVSLVTLRSSGTDILYGCHLLLDVCTLCIYICAMFSQNVTMKMQLMLGSLAGPHLTLVLLIIGILAWNKLQIVITHD
jgi:hypothetical protein